MSIKISKGEKFNAFKENPENIISSMKITGFGCSHNFKDADGKIHKFSTKHTNLV